MIALSEIPAPPHPPAQYLEGKHKLTYPEPRTVFPKELIDMVARNLVPFGEGN